MRVGFIEFFLFAVVFFWVSALVLFLVLGMASFFTGFVPSFFAGVYGNVGKGSYWVFTELLFDLERVFLIGCTGFHRVLLGFVELFSLWKGFYWVLLGFTGFYRVITGGLLDLEFGRSF